MDGSNAGKQLNELHVNLLGKILLVAVGAWLVGRATNLKIRGTRDEIDAITSAMMASRRFQDELGRPGATVETVMEKLGLKHATARQFEEILGIEWPLALFMFIGFCHAAFYFITTIAA